jgi:integrase
MVINEKAIDKLKPVDKRLQIMDDSLKGFGVRVGMDGRKSFFWSARINGKLRFRFLGEYPPATVKDARAAAKDWNEQAAAWKVAEYQGPDPFAKKTVIPRSDVPTFRELVEAYIEGHIKENANRPDSAVYQVRWQVKRHLETWQDRKIDQISLADVLAVKNKCGKKRHAANRVVEFIKALYNWSARNREGKINFWPVENPATGVELYDEKPRERFLQPEELVRFEAELENETCQDLKDFLALSMATGARKSDVFSMRWEDIQWERKNWLVPYPKNGESYNIGLEPIAVAILGRRHKEKPDSETYVFPGPGKTGHLRDLKKPWQAFRKRAGIPDVHVHDLRRTMASYQAIAGVPLQQIAATLGHRSMQSTLVYARLQDQAVRDARAAGEAKKLEMMAEAKHRATKKPKQLKVATA